MTNKNQLEDLLQKTSKLEGIKSNIVEWDSKCKKFPFSWVKFLENTIPEKNYYSRSLKSMNNYVVAKLFSAGYELDAASYAVARGFITARQATAFLDSNNLPQNYFQIR